MSVTVRKGPLSGLRVVELSHVMAGPACGLMLADMGAEVIKVEKVPGGDDSRRMIPPLQGGEATAFMMMNRNKRGLALDLKHPDGKAALHRLLDTADVLIENYRLGTLARLGFDYESVAARNPGIVWCELSGFGRSGPYAERGGFDLIAQGMSGLMSITGEGPGRPPVKVGAPVTDIVAGYLAAMGVLAALHERERSGRGQRVDTSLFEAGIALTYWQSAIALATGEAPGPLGSAHPLSAPYQAFETADGWITVGGANQNNWLRLLEVIGARDLAEDPRFTTPGERLVNREPLAELLNQRFRTRSSAEWLEKLEAVGCPAGPVLDVVEMQADPQALAREMVVELEHPTCGPMRTLGLPIKLSRTPGAVLSPAPRLGEHGRALLAELGYSAAEVEAMIEAGATVVPEQGSQGATSRLSKTGTAR